MDSNMVWQIILQLTLILLNAIFASAEIAVISFNDNKLAKLASQGNKRALKLARLTNQPARFLATIQVAITLSGFLGSAFAAGNFSNLLVKGMQNIGINLPAARLETISVIIITLILSYLTLLFGELVPKRIAMKQAERLALGLSGLLNFISKIFLPIVWLLTSSTNGILRLLGIDPNSEDEKVTEEDIRMMVDVGKEKGTIDTTEREFIQNVFEFDDLDVGEIATHRVDVAMLMKEDSLEEWEKIMKETRHTFYPVCGENADDVLGILNIKDYYYISNKSKEKIIKCLTPAYFVSEHLRCDVLFQNMKENKTYFSVVLDEYGGMNGIITINDLVEELVGDLLEDSEKEPEITQLDDSTWQIRGAVPLDDVEEKLEVSLPSETYDTFGGYIFGLLGSIPDDGTQFDIETEQLIVDVKEINEHRIELAIVTKKTV